MGDWVHCLTSFWFLISRRVIAAVLPIWWRLNRVCDSTDGHWCLRLEEWEGCHLILLWRLNLRSLLYGSASNGTCLFRFLLFIAILVFVFIFLILSGWRFLFYLNYRILNRFLLALILFDREVILLWLFDFLLTRFSRWRNAFFILIAIFIFILSVILLASWWHLFP